MNRRAAATRCSSLLRQDIRRLTRSAAVSASAAAFERKEAQTAKRALVAKRISFIRDRGTRLNQQQYLMQPFSLSSYRWNSSSSTASISAATAATAAAAAAAATVRSTHDPKQTHDHKLSHDHHSSEQSQPQLQPQLQPEDVPELLKPHSDCNLCGVTACPKHAQFYLRSKLDAFAVLQMNRQFEISPAALKMSYIRLMEAYHPDRHHHHHATTTTTTTTTNSNSNSNSNSNNSSEIEEDEEEMRMLASQVTQAYDILKSPHSRATHLLHLMGKVSDTDGESIVLEEGRTAKPTLLMEIMEFREAIEDATTEEQLQSLREENAQQMQKVCQQLGTIFDGQKRQEEQYENEELDHALDLTIQLQYYYKIDQAIREKRQVS